MAWRKPARRVVQLGVTCIVLLCLYRVDWFWWLDDSPFMPRSMCGIGWKSDPWMVHASRLSNFCIGISYVMIPVSLIFLWFNWRNTYKHANILILFSIFIFFSGLTHFSNMWAFTTPTYRLFVMVEMITATISTPVALFMIFYLGEIATAPSPEEHRKTNDALAHTVALLSHTQEENKRLYALLENKLN